MSVNVREVNYEKENDNCDNFKYEVLRRVMPILRIKNEKLSYLIFMMFFPIRLIQEQIYRYKNNKNARLYFNKIHKQQI